ncbi:MAG: ribosome biogenesis GTPase Der [Caldimicrobium sp.]
MFQAVIVGRPNVGKSTLFNTLIGERKAIVERTPGITRDFMVDYIELEEGKGIKLIDTGGIDLSERDFFSKVIREIVEKTLYQADLILFVVDAKEGLVSADEEIASYLRKLGKPIWLIVNKVESKEDEKKAQEFYALGFSEIFFISAREKKNIPLLKEALYEIAKDRLIALPEGPIIKVAILGRPNVGKSTLLNKLVGYERVIVSEIPGTTRDCVDVLIERERGPSFLLIDTPGIRRRARIEERAEKFSVDKALDTLKKIDVVLFLITAEEGVTHQDKTLLRQVEKNYKACLLLINKWDLFEKNKGKAQVFLELVKHHLKFLPWLPVLPISAKRGLNVEKILPMVEEVYAEYHKRIPTSKVNEFIEELKKQYTFNVKGKRLKIYYATQVEVSPPTFVVFVNVNPEDIPKNVEKFFRKSFQQFLGFEKVPVKVIFRLRS